MAALPLLCSGAVLDDAEVIEQPSAAELLAHISERGDLIARSPDGRAFVLLDLDGGAFDRLCAFGSEHEDLEDEPDDDGQDEPSGAEIHPLDRHPRRSASR